jgi:hypothetical protein
MRASLQVPTCNCKNVLVFALLHRLSRGGEWTRLRREVKKLTVTSNIEEPLQLVAATLILQVQIGWEGTIVYIVLDLPRPVTVHVFHFVGFGTSGPRLGV